MGFGSYMITIQAATILALCYGWLRKIATFCTLESCYRQKLTHLYYGQFVLLLYCTHQGDFSKSHHRTY